MLYDPKWKPKDDVVIQRDDLEPWQITALLRVREALKSGEITRKQFVMDLSYERSESCGTVGCIGGWMGIFGALDAGFTMEQIFSDDGDVKERFFAPINGRAHHQQTFYNLFYPFAVAGKTRYYFGYKATPKDGIKAIENFLAGEEYPWKDWNGKEEY